jgi:hypothetical protein
MSEFVTALHSYLPTKFAPCERGGCVNQGSQGANDALCDTKSQKSRNDYYQTTYAGHDEQRSNLRAFNLVSGF